MEEKKVFIPHELKTIEVDAEKKIFRVNGEDFGQGCSWFSIDCTAGEKDFFNIRMRIDKEVHFLNYDEKGTLTKAETFNEETKKCTPTP